MELPSQDVQVDPRPQPRRHRSTARSQSAAKGSDAGGRRRTATAAAGGPQGARLGGGVAAHPRFAAPDPLEQTTPLIELTGSSPAAARHALTQVGRGRLPDPALYNLLVGISEAVTNALLYGDPPTTVRIWATADRVVVHVHDHGLGPANPLAGLIPPPASRVEDAERGLWLTHRFDIDVALIYSHDGFTVRLRGGAITG